MFENLFSKTENVLLESDNVEIFLLEPLDVKM